MIQSVINITSSWTRHYFKEGLAWVLVPLGQFPYSWGGESEIFFSDKQLAFNFPGEIRFTTYLEICQIYSVAFSLG